MHARRDTHEPRLGSPALRLMSKRQKDPSYVLTLAFSCRCPLTTPISCRRPLTTPISCRRSLTTHFTGCELSSDSPRLIGFYFLGSA
jgi:hypothetical protein